MEMILCEASARAGSPLLFMEGWHHGVDQHGHPPGVCDVEIDNSQQMFRTHVPEQNRVAPKHPGGKKLSLQLIDTARVCASVCVCKCVCVCADEVGVVAGVVGDRLTVHQ